MVPLEQLQHSIILTPGGSQRQKHTPYKVQHCNYNKLGIYYPSPMLQGDECSPHYFLIWKSRKINGVKGIERENGSRTAAPWNRYESLYSHHVSLCYYSHSYLQDIFILTWCVCVWCHLTTARIPNPVNSCIFCWSSIWTRSSFLCLVFKWMATKHVVLCSLQH